MSPLKQSFASLIVARLLTVASAQANCGGSLYAPGTKNFTLHCFNAIQTCIDSFQANASLVDCNDDNRSLWMQQQANRGATGPNQNNDAGIAFQDIRDLCILSGQTTGTWGYSDNQWYWIAADDACYTTDPTRTDVVRTHEAPYCIQNRDSGLPECYPEPKAIAAGSGPIKVVKTGTTPNGFHSAAKGWNTFGVQALKNGSEVVPSFAGQAGLNFRQEFVQAQCEVLTQPGFRAAGYDLCSLDSGWQAFNQVDDHGRITYNHTRFNMPQLGTWLHNRGLKLGVYVTPGVPCLAANKTILNTGIKVGDVLNGNNNQIFCDWDFSKDGVQQWHDSVVSLWASWGVDMIKLDFITPGSPSNGANLACDSSDAVRMYREAIRRSGRPMRLHISWKLCRNEQWLPVWNGLAESMRTDQDLDNYGYNTFVDWQVGQRAINNYRQYIGLQMQRNAPITTRPDMDNLFVANAEKLTGVNDTIRTTLMNHWLGAGANLILGSDLTQMDDLGRRLLTSPQSVAAARFFARYPMQPRNPGTGGNLPQQLQAWVAGPADGHDAEAYVLLANYGANLGQSGFSSKLCGTQRVAVTLEDLGIAGCSWIFTDIWAGNSTLVTSEYAAWLTEGESQLLHLRRG